VRHFLSNYFDLLLNVFYKKIKFPLDGPACVTGRAAELSMKNAILRCKTEGRSDIDSDNNFDVCV